MNIFKFSPFSKKQKQVLTWWHDESPVKDKEGIIADGSIRSGKTLSMGLSFVMWAMSTFSQQNFAMCGKTIGSFRRNVWFWLKLALKLRGYKTKEIRNENLVIISKKGISNYFYIFGGKDERSQDLIQGMTLAGILFDEVGLMPESFVKQATARCSVEGSKFWFNCNPQGPYHWFKLDWIDNILKHNLLLVHFVMDDNLSLSDKIKKRYYSMYSGVFFKRFILGLWVMAEGIIYDMFEEGKNVKSVNEQWDRQFVAIDYGIQNPMTFGLYGVKGIKYHLRDYYYHSGRDSGQQKTDSLYADELEKFIGKTSIKYITIDPSATSFISEVKSRDFFKDIKIIPARNSVMSGIQSLAIKIQEGNFTIEPHCKEDLKEFFSYIWDKKAGERGKDEPLKENDHCMDRNRYAVYTDIKVFSKRVNYSGRGAKAS